MAERPATKVKPPPFYQVVMLNDDVTPMEFVVGLLIRFFDMEADEAIETMLRIHNEGKGVVGVYSLEIAETKVLEVTEVARTHDFPLECVLQRA